MGLRTKELSMLRHNPVLLTCAILGFGVIMASTAMILGCRPQPTLRNTGDVEVSDPGQIGPAVRNCTGRCEITLRPGKYGDLSLRGLNPPAGAVFIDLGGSTFTLGHIAQSSNLVIDGGTVGRGNQWGQCWVMDMDTNVSLSNASADHCAAAGFIITRSHTITLTAWRVTSSLCDGVTVSGTDGFVIQGGLYAGYFLAANSCHADGVQMWGMDGYPIRNGQIVGNRIFSSPIVVNEHGAMGVQGISMFNNRTDQEKITVTDNEITVNGTWCVAIMYTREVLAENNRCTNIIPRPWNGRYGWTGSTGRFGPNLLDGQVVND